MRQKFGSNQEKIFIISSFHSSKALIAEKPAKAGLGALLFAQDRPRQGSRFECIVIDANLYRTVVKIEANPKLRSEFVAVGPVRG